MMFDLFSDIFTYRDNALTRIDPRVKLLVAVAALVAVVASTQPVLPILLFAFCLGSVAALRVPGKLVMLRLAAPLSTVAVLIVIQTLTTGTTPLASLSLGGWTLTARAEGLRLGLHLGARVLGALSIVLLLGIVTPAHRIFQALRSFRLSREWVEIAILMYRYIFVLMDRAGDLAAAQRLRLGYRAPGRTLSSLGALAGATVVHSFEQAGRTHNAMRLRGYRGTMPFGPLPALGSGERRLLALAVISVAAAYGFCEWGIPR
jgi:cobalt/nickel transport system permease protein